MMQRVDASDRRSVRAAVAAIEQAVVTIVREFSLPSTQDRLIAAAGVSVERAGFGVLVCVSERDGARVSELAQLLGVDTSTASRQVTALEHAGFVRRVDDPLDGRAVCVKLTADGTGIFDALHQVRHRFFRELLAGWPPADVVLMAALLDRLALQVPEQARRT